MSVRVYSMSQLNSAGGSVQITSAGAVNITPKAGQTLTVSTGATFGDSVQIVTGTGGGIGFVHDWTTTGAPTTLVAKRSGVTKQSLLLENATNDWYFSSSAEALRIIQATAYVQVALRLGVGISPTSPLHVVGNVSLIPSGANDQLSVVASTTVASGAAVDLNLSSSGAVGVIVCRIINSKASSTVAVLQVRGGATPAAGGNIQEWQTSTPTTVALIRSDGLGDFSTNGKGIATLLKAGTPSDADWTTAPPVGTLVVDSTGSKIWARTAAATWKGVAIA